MNAPTLVAVAAIVGISAVVQLAAGFGFSLTAVPLLALVIDTKTASMLAAVLSLVNSAVQAYEGRHVAVRHLVKDLCIPAFVGMPFGLWLFHSGSDRALRLFLGVSTIVLVGLLMRGVDLRGAPRSVTWMAGGAAGVLSTSINTNGPPLVFLLQARGLPPDAFRATITATFTVTGIVGLAGRLAVGGMTTTVWHALAVAPIGLAIGTLAGLWVRKRLDAERFRRMVEVLLIAAALSSILAALRA